MKNNRWNSLGQLFCITGKLISDQSEITGVRSIDFQDATWMQTSLLCEKVYRFTNAKAYVFTGSVLCLGKVRDDPIANWKRQIQWYSENNHFKEMNRIDGRPTEFEWKIFPGITALGLLEKIQQLLTDLQCEPELFMSMFNDIVWDAKGNTEQCVHNSQVVAEYARKFSRGIGHCYGTYTHKPGGSWGSNGRRNDGQFLAIQSSNISCLQCRRTSGSSTLR